MISDAQSRCEALWRRFTGLFGGEALTRKFGPTPPEEWIVTIGRLKDYELEKGMRRLVYSGKSYIPSLPEFLKLCREIGGESDTEENRKPLTPDHQIEGMDAWEMAANRHLMAHVFRMVHDRRTVSETDTKLLVEGKKAWAADARDASANGTLPEDHGEGWFREYMQAAEVQMAS